MTLTLRDITDQTGFLVVKAINNTNAQMDFCYELKDGGTSLGLVYRPLDENSNPTDTLVFVAHLSSTEKTAKEQFQSFLLWVNDNAETLKENGITQVVSTGDHNIDLSGEDIPKFFAETISKHKQLQLSTCSFECKTQKSRGVQQQLDKIDTNTTSMKDGTFVFTLNPSYQTEKQTITNLVQSGKTQADTKAINTLSQNQERLDHVPLTYAISSGNTKQAHTCMNVFSLAGADAFTVSKNLIQTTTRETYNTHARAFLTQIGKFFKKDSAQDPALLRACPVFR